MRRTLQIATFLIFAAVHWAPSAAAQTVDEIIAKNLEAKGGIETLQATRTVRMTGTLESPGAPSSMTIKLEAKRPNLMRREMRMGDQSMISAFDGTTAWVQQGEGPARTLSGPEAEQLRQGAEFDSVFVNYKEAGHRIELIGTETVNGKPAHHLRVTRKEGQVQDYYIDVASGLEVKMSMDTEQAGIKLRVDTELSDYRRINGRMVPFKMRQSTNGQPAGEITFQSVEFNVPMDDAHFAPPK